MEGVFSACSSGNIDLVKGLIDGGVSPLVRDDQQNTLLHVCCASDPSRLDLLQYLLFLIKPSNVLVSQLHNANGSIPLHLACTNGKNDVVQFLVPRYCGFSDFLIPDTMNTKPHCILLVKTATLTLCLMHVLVLIIALTTFLSI